MQKHGFLTFFYIIFGAWVHARSYMVMRFWERNDNADHILQSRDSSATHCKDAASVGPACESSQQKTETLRVEKRVFKLT